MDDIFLRELIIFVAVLGIFIGFVPMMIKGHYAERIEVAVETATRTEDASAAQARLSKKRRARARDAGKKTGDA